MNIPIHDIKGTQFGMLVLNDDAAKILQLTGVLLTVELDINKQEPVIAYLH